MREAKGTTDYRKRKATERADKTLREYLDSLSLEKLTDLLIDVLKARRQGREIGDQRPTLAVGTDCLPRRGRSPVRSKRSSTRQNT
jgi:hypothetical protein